MFKLFKEKDNIHQHEEDASKIDRNNYHLEEVEKKICTEHKYVCGSIGLGTTKRMSNLENEIKISHQTENL